MSKNNVFLRFLYLLATLSPLITNRLGPDMSYEVSKAVFEIFEQIVIEGKFRPSE